MAISIIDLFLFGSLERPDRPSFGEQLRAGTVVRQSAILQMGSSEKPNNLAVSSPSPCGEGILI
jgi:hypothetical protein